MPRLSRNALSAARVRTAPPGSHTDGNGLMLRVRTSGSRQWIQRITIHGRRVDLGLGGAELVSLADARRVAAENRAIARTGGDPRRSRVPTFAAAEAACFAQRRECWRTESPAKTWRIAMDRHLLPKLGGVPVDQVGSAAVHEVLRPLAVAGKHATVKAAGSAITAVLEWARIEEFRSEGSPVEAVRRALPKRTAGPRHHDALHWSEVGAALDRIDGTRCAASTKRALRFTALTAARQVEVRRATWGQFDLDAAVWVRPGESMKTGREHRVPLSRQALAVLEEAQEGVRGGGAGVPRVSSGFDAGRPGDDAGASERGDRGVGTRVPVELQGLGARSRGGGAAVGAVAGARGGLGDGGGVRARRPAGEAAPHDAAVGRTRSRPGATLARDVAPCPSAALRTWPNGAPMARGPRSRRRRAGLPRSGTAWPGGATAGRGTGQAAARRSAAAWPSSARGGGGHRPAPCDDADLRHWRAGGWRVRARLRRDAPRRRRRDAPPSVTTG